MTVRTWAPRGQTPLLRVKLTRVHLSAISGITLDGRLFMQVCPASYDAEAVVGFLRVLLRKISGKIVLIWDGSPIHRAHEIKDLLAAQKGDHHKLLSPMWLLGLVSFHGISSNQTFIAQGMVQNKRELL